MTHFHTGEACWGRRGPAIVPTQLQPQLVARRKPISLSGRPLEEGYRKPREHRGAECTDLLADGISIELSVFIGSLRAASQISALHFIRRQLIGASNEDPTQGAHYKGRAGVPTRASSSKIN